MIGFMALGYITQSVYRTAQLSVHLKIDTKNDYYFKILNISMVSIMLVCLVLKLVLCIYFDTTLYFALYQLVILCVAVFDIVSCWVFLHWLSESINSIKGGSPDSNDWKVLYDFQIFVYGLTFLLVVLCGLLAYTTYYFIDSPYLYFSNAKLMPVPQNAILALTISIFGSYFTWLKVVTKVEAILVAENATYTNKSESIILADSRKEKLSQSFFASLNIEPIDNNSQSIVPCISERIER